MSTIGIRSLPRPDRRFGMKLCGNVIRDQKRLVLLRAFWNRGTPGDGEGYGATLSVSICWAWYDLCVGLFVRPELDAWIAYLCVLPCLPIRIHYKRSYGGVACF